MLLLCQKKKEAVAEDISHSASKTKCESVNLLHKFRYYAFVLQVYSDCRPLLIPVVFYPLSQEIDDFLAVLLQVGDLVIAWGIQVMAVTAVIAIVVKDHNGLPRNLLDYARPLPGILGAINDDQVGGLD